MAGVAYQDYAHTNLIVVWGMNPSVSGIHLVPTSSKPKRGMTRRRGPTAHPTGRARGLHLPIHPGTDLPLALSIIRWLFAEGRADRAFLAAHAHGADSSPGGPA
jgi:anaerobic selenocysteine-containing dehydrogenase